MSANVLTQIEKIHNVFRERTSQSHSPSVHAAYAPDLSLSEQYTVLASHVALVDRSWLTKPKLVRKDSVDSLQWLSTNDLSAVPSGSCCHTVLRTEKGKRIDLVTLYQLSDVTRADSMSPVFRPDLEKVLPIVQLKRFEHGLSNSAIQVKVGDLGIVVESAEAISASSANVSVPAHYADNIWKKLLDEGPPAGLQPCSIDALEIQRIKHGFPVYGGELIEEVNPLEAGLERFVSLTRGCYIGHKGCSTPPYKKFQKRLVGLDLAVDCNVAMGASIAAQGSDVGWVTSAAQSPHQN